MGIDNRGEFFEIDWIESANDTIYCFRKDKGQIVGMIHKVAHTSVYMSKVVKQNDEYIIGRYINQECAKAALFEYWAMESRTLLE